jgi:hypothetical protein
VAAPVSSWSADSSGFRFELEGWGGIRIIRLHKGLLDLLISTKILLCLFWKRLIRHPVQQDNCGERACALSSCPFVCFRHCRRRRRRCRSRVACCPGRAAPPKSRARHRQINKVFSKLLFTRIRVAHEHGVDSGFGVAFQAAECI